MPNIIDSIYSIRQIEDLARKDTPIHRLNPLIKLLTTVVYLFVVISFSRYEVGSILPLTIYPVLVFVYAELPVGPILRRIMLVEPLIIGIGILNPIMDHHIVVLGSITFSRGWIVFASLFIKSTLTIVVSILLVATTGMNELATALRMLKIPKIFVLQLLLTYRYISVLMEEVFRMLRAYSMRAPMQKGIHRSAWGSFAGQLLLRTFERAEHIYEAMRLRGFTGEFNTVSDTKIRAKDYAYMIGWSLFFIIVRMYNIPILIGKCVL